jgi:3-phenylpropionate/trans-cinnamate dioxygenase ferredoxin component
MAGDRQAQMVPIGKVGEIAEGAMKQVNIPGHSILLARVGDLYYAVANNCTHRGGNLSQGTLQGTVVTCPWHHSRFDVRDGRVVRWLNGGLSTAIGGLFKPEQALKSYPVQVDGDRIMAEVETSSTP